MCSLTALTLCTNEFSFYYFYYFPYLCAISTLAPLCFEPVTVIFFPNFVQPFQHAYHCNRFRICIQLLCSLTSTLFTYSSTYYMYVCMYLYLFVHLYACCMRIYSLTFFIVIEKGGVLVGLRNWLFCFSIKYFSFIKFSIYKNVHSFARTICIRCEFVMCCCSHRRDGFLGTHMLLLLFLLFCSYFICLSSAFVFFLLYL